MPNVEAIPGTAVFVHGFPETSRVWDSLRRVLERDSIALALPGFGAPRPAGFSATKDAYAEWLADALDGIERPIDLVGHDVGALLSLRVATAFDVALRSFAVDVAPILVARRLGAETARLDDLEHCWMAQAPAVVAAVLQRFWFLEL